MMRSLHAAGVVGWLIAAGVSAQEHTVVALSHSDFTVYEVEPASGRIVNRFEADHQPHEAAVTADGELLYVAIPAGHVVILDGRTFQEVGRIESEYFTRPPRGGGGGGGAGIPATSTLPHGVALNADGSKLYVGVEWAEVPALVVYDTRAGRVLGKIDVVLDGGHFLAVDPRTDKLYYPMRGDDRVLVIDTKTDRIVKIVPVEGGPVGVDFTPGGEAWIHSDGDGSVTVIDTRTDEVVARIEGTGEGAGRIAVSPDGRWAASTRGGSGDVAVIDTRTKEVVGRVEIGGLGFPLFSPDSRKLYVMSARPEGHVAVVDVGSLRVEARHPVGVNPFGGVVRSARRVVPSR